MFLPARATAVFHGERRRVADLVSGSLTVAELEAGGLTARQLGRCGVPGRQLRAIGFGADGLRAAGYAPAALGAAGFDVAELRAAGCGIGELYWGCCLDMGRLKAAGYTAGDAHGAGMGLEHLSKAFSLEEIIQGGYGPLKISRVLGVGRNEMLERGMPPGRLAEVDRVFPTELVIGPGGPAFGPGM